MTAPPAKEIVSANPPSLVAPRPWLPLSSVPGGSGLRPPKFPEALIGHWTHRQFDVESIPAGLTRPATSYSADRSEKSSVLVGPVAQGGA